MNLLTVALLQMAGQGYDQAANLRKGEQFCRRAAALGADIALFPEMWNIGYTFERGAAGVHDGPAGPSLNVWRSPELWDAAAREDRIAQEAEALTRWRAQAAARDGPFVRHYQELARELGMAIAVTYLEQWEGGPRNAVSLIDRRGNLALTYAKVHTCDFDLPEACLTPGDGFFVAELDTAAGPVKLGAMICYDREFPESARALMLGGAEIILVPNACELDALRTAQIMVRACENMAGLAVANYAGPGCGGRSAAFHPVAYREGAPQDTTVIVAGEEEEVALARFDLDEVRDWRRRETWGAAFRRPQHYGALVSPETAPPFVRVNVQRERWDQTRRQR